MKYAKAVVAAALAGLGSLSTAMTDNHITGSEWITVGIFTLTALGGVWAIPNRPT